MWISIRNKFQLKLTIFALLDRIYPEMVFPTENKQAKKKKLKKEHILHIRIIICTKFLEKLKILFIFGPNLFKNGISSLNQIK